MNRTIIHELPGWRVTSWGNGLAYALDNLAEGLGVYFQGDDADGFRNELEGLTEGVPCLSYADALPCIWSDYGELAQPIEEVTA